MTRAYIRVDPAFYEKKVIEDKYPLPAVAALVGCLCLAEMQPNRGRFRDLSVLRALLGPASKWTGFLIDNGDLLVHVNGTVYIDGWDEWQEGDVTVKERMNRIRNRKGDRIPDRNSPVIAGRGGAESGAKAGQVGRKDHHGQHPNCSVCEAAA